MVININSNLYRFTCVKCRWSEDILVKTFPYSLLYGGDKQPARCPKCGENLKKEKLSAKF